MIGWWEADKDEVGRELVRCAILIEESPHEATREELNLVHARMFENAPVPSLYHFGGQPGTTTAGYPWTWADRSVDNVLRSVVMTASSQITRNRPRARFLTTDGNWKQKRKAKKLTQFCDGLASETKMYQLTQRCWIDAAVFDCGGIQVIKDNGRIRLVRVLSNEVLIDENDGLHGKPKTMYRRRFMDRDVVMAKFGGKPPKKDAIEDDPRRIAIKNTAEVDPLYAGGKTNLIAVYESWHLTSADGGKGGKHAIAVQAEQGNGTLFVEDWDKEYFPIALFRWEDALSGCFGRSMAEQLAPQQYELDKLNSRIERMMRLNAPRMWLPRQAKIVKSKVTNDDWSLVEGGQQAPQPMVWPSVPADYFEERDRRIQRMYDGQGVSRNAAQGQKETGVTSGEAIRESIDVQQARMAVAEQRWEQFHVELFKIMVDFARDLGADGTFAINVPGKQFLESIDWKDVNMAADEYTLEVFPTSYLPITPQGRLSTVQDLVQSGIWTPERAASALDDLDVERAMSMDQSAEHYLEQQMERMLYDGKAQHPDEFTDLKKAIKLGAQYINMGRDEHAPEKNVEYIRRYLDDVRDLQKAAVASAPQPPAPPGAPPGQPMAPEPPEAAGMPLQ